ncbi:MAG TPA: class I SAM-dependent methyltransferase [Isosphaeraceae bacterium]|jgi:hypothetical protein
MRRDLGDFQTPPGLVAAVLDRLDALDIPRSRVLEPTCGRGHFVSGLLARADPPAEIRGFEIQPGHLDDARAIDAGPTLISLEQADLFSVDLAAHLRWSSDGPLFVVGNPPWVTTAALGRLGSTNGPARARVEGLTGLDSRTGRSNFDLAEAVWVKLLTELAGPDVTIALLCKVATARNVLRRASRAGWPIVSASIHRIDARRWFAATVDACLFVVRLGRGAGCYRAEVYPDLGSEVPETTIGVVDDLLVSDLNAFEHHRCLFGRSPRVWRQGIKHDAAAVMELTHVDGGWRNGLGEAVDVEPDRLYPLLKGADLARSTRPARSVIVTQRRLGEDTNDLAASAPRLWSYLQGHSAALGARRSKVYESRPPFAMFGVGDYAFAAHKVAVAGLHKAPRFSAIGPVDGRPVLLDDTCYILPCENAGEARRIARGLNGPAAQSLLKSLCFADAKRPVTKAILARIDLDRLPARSRVETEA